MGCSQSQLSANGSDFSQLSSFECAGGWQPVTFDGDLAFNSSTGDYQLELLSSNDVSILQQLYELLNAAFSTPGEAILVGAFMAGITVPMIAYLTAYMYGKVIHFAEADKTDC